jgi:hypothetical protein
MVGILLCRTIISLLAACLFFLALLGKNTQEVFLINRSPIKKKENKSAPIRQTEAWDCWESGSLRRAGLLKK